MELTWIRYQKDDDRKYLLLLVLDEDSTYYIGVLSDSFTSDEASLMLRSSSELQAMPVAERMGWVKKHMARAFNKGFRKIRKDNVTVIRKWQIKKKETPASA